MCPTWSQTCKACGKQKHFEKFYQLKDDDKRGAIWCFEDEEAIMDVLILLMIFDLANNAYRLGNNNSCEEVEAILIPFSMCPDLRQARDIPCCPSHLVQNLP